MNAADPGFHRSFGSIRTRLTLSAVTALVIGIAATTFVLIRQAERDTLTVQRERQLHETARTADILSRGAIDLQHAMVSTAAIMTPTVLADVDKLIAFLEAQPVLRGMFSSIYFIDTRGRMLLLADSDGLRQPPMDLGDRPYFRQAVEEMRPIVGEAVLSRFINMPIVPFAAPLVSSGRVYGVIGASLRLSNRDLLADAVQRSEDDLDALNIVTDATGRILAHPDRSRILQSVADEPRMARGFERWLAAGAATEPSGLLIDQPGEVLAVAGVPSANWVLWRALPESKLLAPLHAARKQALQWAAIIVVAASLVVFGLIGWLLRPLLLLQRRALHLFDTGHDIDQGWPRAGGEIGELVRVLRQVGAERTQLERLNADVLARLGSVMAAAPLGIMFTRGGRFELVSDELCRMFGRPQAHFVGRGSDTILAEADDVARLDAAVRTAFAQRVPYRGEWPMRKADGSVLWASLRGQSVDLDHPEAGTIWTLTDVSEQRAARKQLEWSVGHDPLTGLANRTLFERSIGEVFAARASGLPAAVIMIDLDRFKPVNDSAGHAAGDAMLKAVAGAITSHTRATDLAARLGGDEFALLLERCPSEVAERIADNVRLAIAGLELPWEGRMLSVGASLGVACLSSALPSAMAWLAQADHACYDAKASGRNAVRVATLPPMGAGAEARSRPSRVG